MSVTSPTAHPLDRPVWHALATSHRRWAVGHGAALRYDLDFSRFAGTADDKAASFADLHAIVPLDGTVAVVTIEELGFPDELTCVRRAIVEQMVLSKPLAGQASRAPEIRIRPMTNDDAAPALSLVALTKPGPFGARTLEMGHYLGAFQGAELVAMAGERMCLPGHVEISAVCTHPDHRGKGLAQEMITRLSQDALDRGMTPFLHAFADNQGALAVYRKLGFTSRTMLHLAVVKRTTEARTDHGR